VGANVGPASTKVFIEKHSYKGDAEQNRPQDKVGDSGPVIVFPTCGLWVRASLRKGNGRYQVQDRVNAEQKDKQLKRVLFTLIFEEEVPRGYVEEQMNAHPA